MDYCIISAQELAGKLKISLKNMYKLLNTGQIPGAKKLNGSWFIHLEIFESSFSKPVAKVKPDAGSQNRHNLV